MNNFDITSIVKCHIVPEDRLKQTEITFLDSQYGVDTSITATTNFPTYGIKVFTKKLSNETVKTSLLTHTDELVKEILNNYYEMSLENGKTSTYQKLIHNIKDDTKKLIAKCYMAGNIIAQDSRFGPSNVIILPDDTYESALKSTPMMGKVLINPTTLYKDKIFVLRVSSDSTQPGLSLFASRSLIAERYIKLTKIMKKLSRNVDDLAFSYILTKVGLSPEKLVQVIHLTDN